MEVKQETNRRRRKCSVMYFLSHGKKTFMRAYTCMCVSAASVHPHPPEATFAGSSKWKCVHHHNTHTHKQTVCVLSIGPLNWTLHSLLNSSFTLCLSAFSALLHLFLCPEFQSVVNVTLTEKVSFLSTLNSAELTGGASITSGWVNLLRGTALRRSQSRDTLTSDLWIHLSLTRLVSFCRAEQTRYWLLRQTPSDSDLRESDAPLGVDNSTRTVSDGPDALDPVWFILHTLGPWSRTYAGGRRSYRSIILL